jgi:hypothetical protein
VQRRLQDDSPLRSAGAALGVGAWRSVPGTVIGSVAFIGAEALRFGFCEAVGASAHRIGDGRRTDDWARSDQHHGESTVRREVNERMVAEADRPGGFASRPS